MRHISKLTIAIIALITSVLFYFSADRVLEPSQSLIHGEIPTFQATKIRNSLYDDEGKRRYLLEATTQKYFSSENSHHFDLIKLHVFDDNGQVAWQILAPIGLLNSEQMLHLSGGVTFEFVPNPLLNYSLRGESFAIELPQRTFRSTHPIELKGVDFKTVSQQLTGSLKTHQFLLSEQVEGIYDYQISHR